VGTKGGKHAKKNSANERAGNVTSEKGPRKSIPGKPKPGRGPGCKNKQKELAKLRGANDPVIRVMGDVGAPGIDDEVKAGFWLVGFKQMLLVIEEQRSKKEILSTEKPETRKSAKV